MIRKRMVTVLVGVSLWVVGATRAEFVPGHIFVVQRTDTFCLHQPQNGPEKIWEIDPLTGDVSLFLELPECVHLTSLAFAPDGTRLRGSALMPNQILEFDSEGNISVALDSSDGIASPEGGNNIAYDTGGNFYVTNAGTATLMRFPAEGGPGTVIADWCDGVRDWTAIGFAADGDLYLCPGGNGCVAGHNRLLRFTPLDWEVSVFVAYPPNVIPAALAADRSGFVYVHRSGTGFNDLARYRAGDSGSLEVLASPGGAMRLTMSPDQTRVYVYNAIPGTRVLAVDVRDGSVTVVAELFEMAFGGGIAVVPFRVPPGDFDLDSDVDLDDFAAFKACVTGPGGLMEPGCGLGDLDIDLDIDLADLGLLQLSFTGR